MDHRLNRLGSWINQQLNDSHRYKGPSLSLEVVSGDASFRRYFRCRYSNAEGEADSVICVDAPPDKENNPAFVKVLEGFHRADVQVPQLLAVDYDDGFMMLSDLGDCLLKSVLSESTVNRYFDEGERELLKIMRARFPDEPLPDYDRPLMMREMELFRDWFCGRYLQMSLSGEDQSLLDEVFVFLYEATRIQETVPVHRDYHTRNLMVLEDGSLGVIDFQDAVMGPVSYDLLSLLRDETTITWPPASIEKRVRRFASVLRRETLSELSDDDFWYGFNVMGAQRHLKVAGIFARLCFRDGKAHYLAHTPQSLAYLISETAVIARLSGADLMQRFHAWLEQQLMPRFREVHAGAGS